MAKEKQIIFEGYKKGNLEDDDQIFNGEFIKTYSKDPKFHGCSKKLM